jgi:hypothetical protein
MNDTINFEILFDPKVVEVLILVLSIAIVLIIQLISNRQIEKIIGKVRDDVSYLKKQSEVQSTYFSQYNDHFNLIARKLKKLEETTDVTSRDISSMAEGITGEVGVGKAIELARRGATVDEILENSNVKKDQAELIVKFHGNES